ncbi:Nuclear control of ATPase protein 2 [Malassezia cuniculi]|uniref:Nuclear control of ATPase protein 2 n=1 Tax=Malassezia cuniculi TaxID=948313 RepID=A0AAF0JAG7_9BASI|nr:Nuclear control of ATPase protein 2 [Malassezia cuniculi]
MHTITPQPLSLAAAVRGDAKPASTARAAKAANDARVSYAYVLEALAGDALALASAENYWRRIAADHSRAGVWWLQFAAIRAEAKTHADELARARDEIATLLGQVALSWHNESGVPVDGAVKALGGSDATPAGLVAAYEAATPAPQLLSRHGVPSRVVRIWPALVIYPLVAVGTTRIIANNWNAIVDSLRNARDTLKGLVVSWIYAPTVRMLRTLRMGEAERRMIVSRDTLQSDLASLERMVVTLLEDRGVRGDALVDASKRVRNGDLTPVMELYEAQIREPMRSVFSGTLIRSVLVQVQKAKVDMEVALSGIDRLLRSQELVIAAVGLAPALFLLIGIIRYARGGLSSLWTSSSSTFDDARISAWEALRRIDHSAGGTSASRYGHILLDAASLRSAMLRLLKVTCRSQRA